MGMAVCVDTIFISGEISVFVSGLAAGRPTISPGISVFWWMNFRSNDYLDVNIYPWQHGETSAFLSATAKELRSRFRSASYLRMGHFGSRRGHPGRQDETWLASRARATLRTRKFHYDRSEQQWQYFLNFKANGRCTSVSLLCKNATSGRL